eukprot:CAMPEP_0113879022 /NCGR_PEP_ID=MMETSP0780_2-20120614/7005_1 /TAXON_ID=652834 /ORGANISM="Palpitomonas bilix" /LENGTH=202 /DNA_ID=CAMNT_0000865553 /DNA_START=79 /DNA_END=687 /DNA_ORIENTATION=- /assembly_acc=CAM_ASM_000599
MEDPFESLAKGLAGFQVQHDEVQRPPIMQAVRQENERELYKLILRGERMDAYFEDTFSNRGVQIERRRTALHEACRRGYHVGVVRLLDAGANPNLLDEDGSSALHWAAGKAQKIAATRREVEAGMKPSWSAEETNVEPEFRHAIVLSLIRAGADVNMCDSFGRTPLDDALQYCGDVDLIAALTYGGANSGERSMNRLLVVDG